MSAAGIRALVADAIFALVHQVDDEEAVEAITRTADQWREEPLERIERLAQTRTISGTPAEVRAELDALPIGTVLRYTEPNRDWRDVPHEVVVKGTQGAPHEWRSTLWDHTFRSASIALDEVPMVVLYEPEVVR